MSTRQAISIDSDFPGGNIVVERIADGEVHLHQELRDTGIDWFYWCFRVRGAEGTTRRFVFTASRAIGVRGPAVSLDHGGTWNWLGADAVERNAFSYTFPAAARDVRFSFGMPYQESHWRQFVASFGAAPPFAFDTLCVSEKGRAVECLLAGCRDTVPAHRVAITSRHHCCEMMANYALEGLIRWLVADPCAEARWLREHAEFLVVPFVDKDGVEDGDQGKGRTPRDHGRDYEGAGLFAAPRAIRERLPQWGAGRLHVALDLHCPWIAGTHNEVIYLVGSSHERNAVEQQRFSEILESVAVGPLPFRAADYLPFGTAWNTAANYAGGKGFSRWSAELPGVVLGSAIEIPYANAGGVEVNQASARAFGRDLGMALAAYLKQACR